MAGMNDLVPTKRVDLGEGRAWEIRIVVTRGMRKAFRAAGLAMLDRTVLAGVDIGDEESVRGAIATAAARDPRILNLDVLDDAYLLAGTVSILPGDVKEPITAVTPEVLDALPEEWSRQVLAEMRVLYAERTEEKKETSPVT